MGSVGGSKREEGVNMRYLPVILERVLEIIPESEACLRADLLPIRQSAFYAPPESSFNWQRAGNVLRYHLGDDKPEGGWQLDVWNVVTGAVIVPESEIPA